MCVEVIVCYIVVVFFETRCTFKRPITVTTKRLLAANNACTRCKTVATLRYLNTDGDGLIVYIYPVNVVGQHFEWNGRYFWRLIAAANSPWWSAQPRASISQDYWGNTKEDWGRKSPSGLQGQSPSRWSGSRSPPEAEAFLWNYT